MPERWTVIVTTAVAASVAAVVWWWCSEKPANDVAAAAPVVTLQQGAAEVRQEPRDEQQEQQEQQQKEAETEKQKETQKEAQRPPQPQPQPQQGVPELCNKPPTVGSEVVICGLKGKAELNGEHGVVQPKSTWPANGRVAVLLVDQVPQRTIAIKAVNLKPVGPRCGVCLSAENDGDVSGDGSNNAASVGGKLLPMGCGCRGSSGWVHAACAVQAAAAQQERAGTWAGDRGRYPWQLCQ